LFTILHNQHVNRIRSSIREGTTVELSEAEPLLSRPASQDKGLELRDLHRALGRLPEAQRAVILLIGLEGMAYGDVAATLGIPIGTVRSRVSRGRDTLRRLMIGTPSVATGMVAPCREPRELPVRMRRPAPAIGVYSQSAAPRMVAAAR
jgi:RNA polymerase sigma-70 factor, ECF subfamily